MSLLTINGLSVAFGRHRDHRVLSDVDLTVRGGEIVGVIGETGSGKTTLARAVVGLSPVVAGTIDFDGTELTALRGRRLRAFRRRGVLQFMFQDPLRALDPQQTVAAIVGEGLNVAGGVARERATSVISEALAAVGLDEALAGRTPGQLSGGQRQRVLLARAVAMRPRLLLCDEPVSALDASNRNHVLRLLDALRRDTGMSIVIISHDLSSLAGIADRVAVLYGGRVVERGPIGEVLTHPLHPYTALLTASAPSVRRERTIQPAQLLNGSRARVPGAHGCVFAARCRFATDACATAPATTDLGDDRGVACHHTTAWRQQLVAAPRESALT